MNFKKNLLKNLHAWFAKKFQFNQKSVSTATKSFVSYVTLKQLLKMVKEYHTENALIVESLKIIFLQFMNKI
jgi:hypothetical protein